MPARPLAPIAAINPEICQPGKRVRSVVRSGSRHASAHGRWSLGARFSARSRLNAISFLTTGMGGLCQGQGARDGHWSLRYSWVALVPEISQ
jgi:hypothetical protein